jgi:hypothetical protein
MESNHADQEKPKTPVFPSPRRTLRTVKQLARENSAFTEASLRWLLFNREVNGLRKAVLKVGRRLLIDEDAFFTWIAEQNGR